MLERGVEGTYSKQLWRSVLNFTDHVAMNICNVRYIMCSCIVRILSRYPLHQWMIKLNYLRSWLQWSYAPSHRKLPRWRWRRGRNLNTTSLFRSIRNWTWRFRRSIWDPGSPFLISFITISQELQSLNCSIISHSFSTHNAIRLPFPIFLHLISCMICGWRIMAAKRPFLYLFN